MSTTVDGNNRSVEALKFIIHDKVTKDDGFINRVVKAHEQLLLVDEDEGNVESVDFSAPDLNVLLGPDGKKFTRSGAMAWLLAEFIDLVGGTGVRDLESKIAVYKSQMISRGEYNKKLSDEFEKAEGEATVAVNDYKEKNKTYLSDKSDYDSALARKQKAETALGDLDGKKVDHNSEEYKNAENELKTATSLVLEKKATLDKSSAANDAAEAVAANKVKVADAYLTKCNSAGLDNNAVINNSKQHLGNLAEMTLLLAEASKTLGEDSNKSLNNDLEIFRAMQKAREQEMEKKAEEIQKQEDKSKAMGCIGKILGFLIAVVSVVGAVFTGGASLALAVVGLALMAADEVGKAITGKSFMAEALKPLMDKIIKPLMEKLGQMLGDMLMAFGVDKDTAKAIGTAIAGVIVVLAMIAAVALIGKGAASKMVSKMAEMITEKIGKLLPQIARDMASGLSQGMNKALQQVKNFMGAGEELGAEAYALQVNKIQSHVTKMQIALTVGQGATNVEKGLAEKWKADATADFMIAKASMDQIQKWITQAIETFKGNFQGTQDMIVSISGYIAKNEETGRFLLRDIKA